MKSQVLDDEYAATYQLHADEIRVRPRTFAEVSADSAGALTLVQPTQSYFAGGGLGNESGPVSLDAVIPVCGVAAFFSIPGLSGLNL